MNLCSENIKLISLYSFHRAIQTLQKRWVTGKRSHPTYYTRLSSLEHTSNAYRLPQLCERKSNQVNPISARLSRKYMMQRLEWTFPSTVPKQCVLYKLFRAPRFLFLASPLLYYYHIREASLYITLCYSKDSISLC